MKKIILGLMMSLFLALPALAQDHVTVNDTDTRAVYSVGGTPDDTFNIPFTFYDEDSDIKILVDGEELSSSAYTVTGNAGASGGFEGGEVVLDDAVSDAAVVVYLDIPIARTTDFPKSGSFNITSLNTQLDKLTSQIAQMEERTKRAVKLPLTSDLEDDSGDLLDLMFLEDPDDGAIFYYSAAGKGYVNGPDVSVISDLEEDVTAAAAAASAASSSAATATAQAVISTAQAAAAEVSATAAAASAASVDFSWQGAWLTATDYDAGNMVFNDGSAYVCILDHTSGASSEPGTGGSWTTYWDLMAQQGSAGAGTGDMLAANNLSDLDSAETARANMGLEIGADVQAYDADLLALAGLTSAADKGIMFTGSGTAAVYSLTAAGLALLDDAAASNQRTTLGLGSAATLTAGTSANNVVQLDGSAKLPAVDGSALTNLPSGGDWTLVEAITASGAASVDFDNFDESACAALKFTFSNVQVSTTSVVLYMQTSTNNGSAYDSGVGNYDGYVSKVPFTAPSASYEAIAGTYIDLVYDGMTTTTDDVSGWIVLIDPSNSSSLKQIFGETTTAGQAESHDVRAHRDSTANIDAIRFDTSAGTITGTFYMHCLANS